MLVLGAALAWAYARSGRGRPAALFRSERIPGAEDAWADDAKFTEYLLNFDHLEGRAKAALFERIGFSRANWRELRDEILRTLPHVKGTLRKENSGGGQNWEALMQIHGSRGTVLLRTFWEVRPNEPPKFLTAYPAR